MLIGRVLLTGAVVTMVVAGAAGQERQKPDYDRVFGMDRVHELRITIAPERFREMQADLASFSRGRGGRAFGPGFAPPPPPLGPLPEGAAFQGPPPGFSAGRGPAFSLPEPIAVRVSVHASGRTWTNVRMRYKGNSSLMAATASGTEKVPFRLEFRSGECGPDLPWFPAAHLLIELCRRFTAP
jgi:spore coat protein H